MEIAVGLYIVGITLIMGYLINKYPRETIAIIFLYIMVLLQVVQNIFNRNSKNNIYATIKRRVDKKPSIRLKKAIAGNSIHIQANIMRIFE